MATETLITREGLQKLKDELKQLETVDRLRITKRIKEAIALGDLSENAEYDSAKDEQGHIEGRIAELKARISTAKIIEETDDNATHVRLGSRVILEDVETGDRFDYTIVGTTEADPFNNRISNESPVGKAILGQVINSENPTVVTVKAPAGELQYRILPPED